VFAILSLDAGPQDATPGQVARPTFDLAMDSPLSLLGYIFSALRAGVRTRREVRSMPRDAGP